MGTFAKGTKVVVEINEGGEIVPYKGVVVSDGGKTVKVKFKSGKKEVVQEHPKKKVFDAEDYTPDEPAEKPAKDKSKEKSKSSKDDDLDNSLDDINLDDIDSGFDEPDEKPKNRNAKKDEDEFEDMTLKELRKACIKADIDYDEDADEDDLKKLLRGEDAEPEKEEAPDYVEMSLKDLRKLCIKRDIDYDDDEEEGELVRKLKKADKGAAPKEEEEEEKPRNKKKVEEEEEEEEKPRNRKQESDDEGTDDWFAVGDDDDKRFSTANENQTFRFWLNPDESALVTFLTDKPLTLSEHNLKIAGKYGNVYTCLTPMGKRCSLCENGKRAQKIKAFYIVDHRVTKSKDGKKTYQDQVRLMPMSLSSYKIFKKQLHDYFDGEESPAVRGLVVKISRTDGDKSPRTGDIFTIKKYAPKEIKPEWKKDKEGNPYDIEMLKKELAPQDNKTLARLINVAEDDER